MTQIGFKIGQQGVTKEFAGSQPNKKYKLQKYNQIIRIKKQKHGH